MRMERWIEKNTASLQGKTVALTGSTGGLGQALCRHLARLGANLILLDRNPQKAASADAQLRSEFPALMIRRVPLDLEDMVSVRGAVEELKGLPMDFLILNAGAYSIPRKSCALGMDNVFQINFAAPYYLVRELMPQLRERGGRVVAVGSIAHRYSKTDPEDVDFSGRTKASLVYGNAKRYLMWSLFALFRGEHEASLAVVHPGITFTNITSHYPKLIFALIKHPMKVVFMSTKKASLSILAGLFWNCSDLHWIGPRGFDIWGYPQKRLLCSVSEAEGDAIAARVEEMLLKRN